MADRTESSIVIAADPADVLDVIADFEAYPEWAREMKEVVVLAADEDGWADRVHFSLDAGVIQDSYTLEYEYDFEEDATGVLSWSLVDGTLLRQMDGSYTLGGGNGATTVTYRLAVALHVPMIGLLKRRAEQTIVDTALKELKRRVEG